MFFQEFAHTSVAQDLSFVFGLVLVFFGIFCLTQDHFHSAYTMIRTHHEDTDVYAEEILQLDLASGDDEQSLQDVPPSTSLEMTTRDIDLRGAYQSTQANESTDDLPDVDEFEDLFDDEDQQFREAQPIVRVRCSYRSTSTCFSCNIFI